MTKLKALTDLLAKVEAESARVSGDFESVWTERHEHWDQDPAAHASAAYLGSLDAAMALHEAVLPGWDAYISLKGRASVDPETSDSATTEYVKGTPARALLIAILKALIAMEKNDD